MYLEEVGPRFAELVNEAAYEGAEIFACDLAKAGANPIDIRMMAESWDSYSFDPPEFADKLREFADALEEDVN